jgi:DnaJ-class molecular chaperone
VKKVPGEGMPILDNGNVVGKGDLYVKFDIKFPESLD